uniref:Uncharacterized protein n=1 Tax=Panagrolaimus sp. JU765 TaxID=591449 RepID=A0AC34PWT9_9BILA
MCNKESQKAHKCRIGKQGDCSGYRLAELHDLEYHGLNCDLQHSQNSCVKWVIGEIGSECYYFSCHHLRLNHGLKFIRNNPEKFDKQMAVTIDKTGVSVYHCYGNEYPAFQHLIYRGCYHPLADYYKRSTYYCNEDNCNSLEKMPFKRPLLEDFKCWKGINKTTNCTENACGIQYVYGNSPTVIYIGCAKDWSVRAVAVAREMQKNRNYSF